MIFVLKPRYSLYLEMFVELLFVNYYHLHEFSVSYLTRIEES